MSQSAPNPSDLLSTIATLRDHYSALREQVVSIEGLFTEPVDRPHPVNLWSLSDRELDQRLARLLSFQNSDMDPHPQPHHITSHRKRLGRLIVGVKRIIMRLFRPISAPLLTPQHQFNQMNVEYNLGCYIRLQQLDQRLGLLEAALQRIEMSLVTHSLSQEKQP